MHGQEEPSPRRQVHFLEKHHPSHFSYVIVALGSCVLTNRATPREERESSLDSEFSVHGHYFLLFVRLFKTKEKKRIISFSFIREEPRISKEGTEFPFLYKITDKPVYFV